jgi:4-amino-4-deoxy-L-arabinose transferase-like glycosyltransferase
MGEWVDKITASFEKHFKTYFFIITILAGFNLFFNLGQDAIKDWDEARHGISAYEMLQSHDFIKPTYMGETEYWNLKPPLGLWLIAFAYKIFGYNVFALRFFSALAAFLVILLSVYLARKLFNSIVAVISGFILATMFAVLFDHAGRAGDFDSLLVLLVILSVICLLKMENNIQFFYLNGLLISLGFLLKSFACLQILGIIAVYLIVTRKIRKIKIWDYLLFCIILVVPIFLWVLMRFYSDGNTFFQKMFSFDLFQRGLTAIEGHKADVFYYLYNMMAGSFPWILLVFIIPFYKRKYYKDERKGLLKWMELDAFWREPLIVIWFAVPFLMFTLVQTKCPWYIKPLYPALGIFIGWLLTSVIKPTFPKKKFFATLLFGFLAISEVLMIGVMIFKKNETGPDQQILLYLNSVSYQNNTAIFAVNWIQSPYQAQVFIAEVLKGLKTYSIPENKAFISRSKTNDLLLMPNSLTNRNFIEQYHLKVIKKNQAWLLARK